MVLSREKTTRITDLLKNNPQGLSITDIVKKIAINRNTAGRCLDSLLVSGQVDMRQFGMAKIYTASTRVPASALLSNSSDFIMQLDSSLRIVFANEPFLTLLRVNAADLFGKNIEYSAAYRVFDDAFEDFIAHLKTGISGKEWHGTLGLGKGDRVFSCHIAPAVFNDGRKGVSVRLEDLTELRHREIALQDSEARLRSIISAAPVGIGVVSGRGFLEVNNRFSEITGYSAFELTNKSIRLLYPTHEDFEKAGLQIYPQLVRTGTSTLRTQWKKKDGDIIDVLLSLSPINPADHAKGITIAVLEITLRTRAEQALRESEEKYRSLVETTGTGYVILDKNGRVITANQEYIRLTGRPMLAEIQGKPVTDWTAPHDLKRNAQEIKQCFRVGQVRDLEIDYQKPDGTIQPIEVNASVIRSDSGDIALTICRDITLRRQAEQALHESEERYRTLIDISPDAVCLYRDGKIIYVNHAAQTLVGASQAEEMVGKFIIDFIHPESHGTLRDTFQKERDGVLAQKAELQILRLDGTSVKVEGRGVRTLIDGKPATLVTIRDIPEQEGEADTLSTSINRYRLLLKQSSDTADHDRKNAVAPGAALALTGENAAEDSIGQIGSDFHPKYRKFIGKPITSLRNTENEPVS